MGVCRCEHARIIVCYKSKHIYVMLYFRGDFVKKGTMKIMYHGVHDQVIDVVEALKPLREQL